MFLGLTVPQFTMLLTAVVLGIVGCITGPMIFGKTGLIKPNLWAASLLFAIFLYIAWATAGTAWIWIFIFITGIFMGMVVPVALLYPIFLPEVGGCLRRNWGWLLLVNRYVRRLHSAVVCANATGRGEFQPYVHTSRCLHCDRGANHLTSS